MSFVSQPANSALSFRFGYTGRDYDSEVGLSYYRARYYEPAVGRFISEDPIGFAAADANLYRYVGNSPANFTDPSGLSADTLLDVGFILYDSYKILKDNVFGNCGNLGENLAALGADVAGALIPFATGAGAIVRGAGHLDDAADLGKIRLGQAGTETNAVGLSQRVSPTGHPTLVEVEYTTPGNAVIEASKPSMQGKLTVNQRYENPGHHDPNLRATGRGNAKFNPTKSVLPDNYVELLKNSIPHRDADGKIYRYAQDEAGNIHRFQPSSDGINDYHWNGSTNGRTRAGKPRNLRETDIPSEIWRAFK